MRLVLDTNVVAYECRRPAPLSNRMKATLNVRAARVPWLIVVTPE